MFMKAFCLLDIKTGSYSQPFFFVHSGQAVRAAMDMAQDASTQVGRYPFDFRLVRIGEFDDSVGLLLSTTHEDLGTIGAIVGAADLRPKNIDVSPDLSSMTAAEVVDFHERSKSA